ncbi:MAG: TatD family hydrolase [Proteobacteria bacterium]|nr:TatD family hydrolase [Pseudomonadota bacterium]
MLIDTHCHLDAAEFDADRARVAQDARLAGVGQIVVPAVELANLAAVRDCCLRHPGCLPAYGIHPLYVGRAGDGDLAALRDWLLREMAGPRPPVAIGEIGLDHFTGDVDPQRQAHFFGEQLKLARELGLPVLLHVRRAQDAVLGQLRRVFGKDGAAGHGGIAHAFNGSRQQAEAFIALGFRLGFGGALTWPRARRIRALAASLPLDALVLETDAPDMPPSFAAGVRNVPAALARIADELAALRGITPQALRAATSANARAVLPRLAAFPAA